MAASAPTSRAARPYDAAPAAVAVAVAAGAGRGTAAAGCTARAAVGGGR